MTPRARTALVGVGGAGTIAVLLAGMLGLHRAGDYHGVYGETLNAVAVAERHTTDVVSAVNFDYRAVDTLGEEYILFTAVIAVATILRKQDEDENGEEDEGEDEGNTGRQEHRRRPATSDATRLMSAALVVVTVVFGLYVTTHGSVSPGGGFQGGVLLATAPLVVYLSADARTFLRIAPEELVSALEASGAVGYVLLGVAPMVFAARPFLTNTWPLGTAGDVLSGGLVFAIDLVVGLEVAGGFVVLMHAFLKEALKRRTEGESKR